MERKVHFYASSARFAQSLSNGLAISVSCFLVRMESDENIAVIDASITVHQHGQTILRTEDQLRVDVKRGGTIVYSDKFGMSVDDLNIILGFSKWPPRDGDSLPHLVLYIKSVV